MLIDCDRCHVRGLACSDCVVSVLLGQDDGDVTLELGADEAEAIGVLAAEGMVPPLRLIVENDENDQKEKARNLNQTFAHKRAAG